MQLFARGLQSWFPAIKRRTYAARIALKPGRESVSVIVEWDESKAGPAGQHIVTFTRQQVLGRTAKLAPLHQRPVKKLCRFVDDVVMAVLEARGVR